MIDFKNILLTTDLSSNAEAARPIAVELARKYNATLHLLHVFEDAGYYFDAGMEGGVIAPLDWVERAQADRKRKLGELAEDIEKMDGVKVDTALRVGLAWREIIAHATENKADLIVIATHGHTGFAHFVFGSVAERVVRSSPCPVLSVKPLPEKAKSKPSAVPEVSEAVSSPALL